MSADDVGGPRQPMLRVRQLVKHFPLKGSWGRGAGTEMSSPVFSIVTA